MYSSCLHTQWFHCSGPSFVPPGQRLWVTHVSSRGRLTWSPVDEFSSVGIRANLAPLSFLFFMKSNSLLMEKRAARRPKSKTLDLRILKIHFAQSLRITPVGEGFGPLWPLCQPAPSQSQVGTLQPQATAEQDNPLPPRPTLEHACPPWCPWKCSQKRRQMFTRKENIGHWWLTQSHCCF